MRIQLLLAIFVLIITLCHAQECISGNCQSLGDLSDDNRKIATDSQNQIRRWFWYYLRGARLLYATIIDSSDQLFMFYIHRNIVGTFQTVSAFEKASKQQKIKNLVRLGAGASVDVPNPNEQPIDVIPSILSIELKPEEYLVNRNEEGKFEVVGGNFVNTTPPQPLIKDARSRLPEIEKTILNTYPEHLKNSQKVGDDQIILTTERVYFLILFNNPQGLYLAIGSDDSVGNKQINTFVRLGKGIAPKQPQRINLDANVIELQ